MFSRSRNVTAALAFLVCLAAAAPSSLLLSRPAHARTYTTPVVRPGDPDEFETRVSGPNTSVGKPSVSSDASRRNVERVVQEPRLGAARREPILRRWKAIWCAVASYVSLLITELDVR